MPTRRRYTHLLQPDRDLFARYLAAMSEPYTHLDFDVRVGEGTDPGPDFSSTMREMGLHLSRRRIDAVGFHGDHIDIIEVTHSAGLTALGQLLTYPSLYAQTFAPVLPLVPVLVTYAFQSDVADQYRHHGIEVHIIARPPAP